MAVRFDRRSFLGVSAAAVAAGCGADGGPLDPVGGASADAGGVPRPPIPADGGSPVDAGRQIDGGHGSMDAGTPDAGDPRLEDISRALDPGVAIPSDPFRLGVASGDPLEDRVILWTRLAPAPLLGGGMPAVSVPVAYEVFLEPSLATRVRSGVATASPEHGHAVHVDADLLDPDTWYWYRFRVGPWTSPVGRTRTAPRAGAVAGSLRFALASCQNYEAGFYTAHAHLAQEDLDLVVFVGDYVYETSDDEGVRSAPFRLAEATTLEDYRVRYGLYKLDSDLQASHAAFPWIVTWDDHEVENNYADRFPEHDDQTEAQFLARRAAAYQAFWEHQPVRVPPPLGPSLQLYRSLGWGDLVDFLVLDTRQHRDWQVCGPDFAITCRGRDDPDRTMLGEEQEAWLEAGLRGSSAAWKVIAQSVMMASFDLGGFVANHDQWDGFTANRQRILNVIRDLDDVVVLAGDVHSCFVSELHEDATSSRSRLIATELTTTSISSTSTGLVELLESLDNVAYANGADRGYLRIQVTKEELTADLRAVSTVARPTAEVRTEASFRVVRGVPGPRRV